MTVALSVWHRSVVPLAALIIIGMGGGLLSLRATAQNLKDRIGDERAISRHLQNGEEFKLSVGELVAFGQKLFTANWTDQDGGGRPLSKGTGQALTDRTRSLSGARTFNRLSGPDANSCKGCHVGPYG